MKKEREMAAFRLNEELLLNDAYASLTDRQKVDLLELMFIGKERFRMAEAARFARRGADLDSFKESGLLVDEGDGLIGFSEAVLSATTDNERKKRWRDAKELEKHGEAVPKASDLPNCNYDAVVALYHEELPTLNKVKIMSNERKAMVRARWRDLATKTENKTESEVLEIFRSYFQFVGESEFLMGKSGNFQADFEWIMRPKNFVKIIERRYHK